MTKLQKRSAKNQSLDELPNEIYAPLGSRGFHPIKLKKCFGCGNQRGEDLRLIEKSIAVQGRDGQEIVDYKVKCGKCGQSFIIRCRNVYQIQGKARVRAASFVSLMTASGEDQGWLGNF